MTAHLKPLDRHVLATVVRVCDLDGNEGTICSDVVRYLWWDYQRRHEHSTIHKRLSDLRDGGYIRRCGGRRSDLTRHGQAAYVPTAKGRRLIARTTEVASCR